MGELITPEIIEYIEYAADKGCSLTGPEDMHTKKLNVIKNKESCNGFLV